MKTTRTTSAPIALAACGLAIGLAILAPPAQAQSDGETVAPKIVIEDQIRTSPGFYNVPLDEREQMPAADTADALKRVPGVSVGRMGGHGLEPVIRGQSQSRINVISDGAYHQGGCPNRMDPPTAYSALGGFDNIAVLKGYGSVLTGPGATGGAVLLERDIRRFEPTIWTSGATRWALTTTATTSSAKSTSPWRRTTLCPLWRLPRCATMKTAPETKSDPPLRIQFRFDRRLDTDG